MKKAVQKKYIPCLIKGRKVLSADYVNGEFQLESRERIRKIVEAEAPISIDLLIKRLINSFGISKAGSRIRPVAVRYIEALKVKTIDEENGIFCWRSDQDPMDYFEYRMAGMEKETKRDITDISCVELANAVMAVLSEGKGLNDEELIRASANRMGYIRLGTNVRKKFREAIDYAVKTNRISRQNQVGSYYTKH
jgi:DNA polymerase III psi subunit